MTVVTSKIGNLESIFVLAKLRISTSFSNSCLPKSLDGKAKISKSDCNNLLQILNSFVFEILGLEKITKSKKVNDKTNDILEILTKLRDEARLNKNYDLSDKIRDMLNNKGIVINDSDTNSSFSIN